MDQYLYKPNNVPAYQKLFQVSVVNLNWNIQVILPVVGELRPSSK